MIIAAGAFRLEGIKLTSTDTTGYSTDLLQGVAAGTLVTKLQIMTQRSAAATSMGPGSTQRVSVYLYNSGSTTYYEYASFNLVNDGDAYQWTDSPIDLVLPSTAWKFRFACRQTALTAGCDLVFTAWGRDVA